MATESSSPSTTGTVTSTSAVASTVTVTSASTGTTPNPSSSPSETNDRDSNSCRKCVKALREIISGLHDNNHDDSTKESPPLTLLKAIIAAENWKSSSSNSSNSQQTTTTTTRQMPNKNHQLKIQETQDGVKVELPVTSTLPNLLRRYSALLIENSNNESSSYAPHPLATSVSSSQEATALEQQQQQQSSQPLTIELKCRKCLTSGPEGGARAFLMGPQPLSIVLCHNRIHSSKEEVQEILTHELVHLYDVQTLQLDLQQCENLAYSEVRAAKAAECRNAWSQLQPYCVKQKAICATNNLFPLQGRTCIQKVFAQAFQDNRPFDFDTHDKNKK